jgi:hypothetical protein
MERSAYLRFREGQRPGYCGAGGESCCRALLNSCIVSLMPACRDPCFPHLFITFLSSPLNIFLSPLHKKTQTPPPFQRANALDMLKVQPEGPYLIGGHSYGGSVAVEVALVLESWGHDVGLVMVRRAAARGLLADFLQRSRPSFSNDTCPCISVLTELTNKPILPLPPIITRSWTPRAPSRSAPCSRTARRRPTRTASS